MGASPSSQNSQNNIQLKESVNEVRKCCFLNLTVQPVRREVQQEVQIYGNMFLKILNAQYNEEHLFVMTAEKLRNCLEDITEKLTCRLW